MHFYTDCDTPLGKVRLVGTESELSGCYFHGQKYFLQRPVWEYVSENPVFAKARLLLSNYFSGQGTELEIALDLQGSTFQKQVWDVLKKIPYGSVTSYGEVAVCIGKPQSARAVAAAIGRNPASVFVPCHRVIGKNGSLTGYAGGLQRKQRLLDIEQGNSENQPGKNNSI